MVFIKFFHYTRDKGFRMMDLEYSISKTDIRKKISHLSYDRFQTVEDLSSSKKTIMFLPKATLSFQFNLL